MQDFDDLVKQSFEAERDLPYSEDAWENLSSHINVVPKHKRNYWWLLLLLPLLLSLLWNWHLQTELDHTKDQLTNLSALSFAKQESIVDTIVIHQIDTIINTVVTERIIKEKFPFQQRLAVLETELEQYKSAFSNKMIPENAEPVKDFTKVKEMESIVHRPLMSSLPITLVNMNQAIQEVSDGQPEKWRYIDYMEASILNIDLQEGTPLDSTSAQNSASGYAVDLGFGFLHKNWQFRTSLGYESINFTTPDFSSTFDSSGQELYGLRQVEGAQQSLRWRLGVKYTQPIWKKFSIAGSLDLVSYFNQKIQTQYHYQALFPYVESYTDTNLRTLPGLYIDNLLLQFEIDYALSDKWNIGLGWGQNFNLQDREVMRFKNAYHIGIKAFF